MWLDWRSGVEMAQISLQRQLYFLIVKWVNPWWRQSKEVNAAKVEVGKHRL